VRSTVRVLRGRPSAATPHHCPNEIPGGNWGALGRVVGFAGIAGYVITGSTTPVPSGLTGPVAPGQPKAVFPRSADAARAASATSVSVGP
jgi:hypothetical protein